MRVVCRAGLWSPRTAARAARTGGPEKPAPVGKRSELFTWKLRPPWPTAGASGALSAEPASSGARRASEKSFEHSDASSLVGFLGPAYGPRSPRARKRRARTSREARAATSVFMPPAAFRKNVSIRGGLGSPSRGARAEPPLKKNPSALSNEKARGVVVRQNFYACRAPCRKVLSSGSVDRHTQYKRAHAEKAS